MNRQTIEGEPRAPISSAGTERIDVPAGLGIFCGATANECDKKSSVAFKPYWDISALYKETSSQQVFTSCAPPCSDLYPYEPLSKHPLSLGQSHRGKSEELLEFQSSRGSSSAAYYSTHNSVHQPAPKRRSTAPILSRVEKHEKLNIRKLSMSWFKPELSQRDQNAAHENKGEVRNGSNIYRRFSELTIPELVQGLKSFHFSNVIPCIPKRISRDQKENGWEGTEEIVFSCARNNEGTTSRAMESPIVERDQLLRLMDGKRKEATAIDEISYKRQKSSGTVGSSRARSESHGKIIDHAVREHLDLFC
ncbi:uncharacterized protein VTP21DRAFT_5289 [Calcarisporiella thermophila]|uniref:uncharacterized protein n=1 Tax=Calcarisporiella thermophila TaxID=911321 RepID=UPI003742C297